MSPPVPGMPLTGSGTSLRHPTHVCPWQDPHVAHPPPVHPLPTRPPLAHVRVHRRAAGGALR